MSAIPSRVRFVKVPLIEALLTKYLAMLGADAEFPRPNIRVIDRMSAQYLGRTQWIASAPETTILELQKVLLGTPRALESVVAHEIIHHVNMMEIVARHRAMIVGGKATERLMQIFRDHPEHGRDFLACAARVNEIMGPGFVTVQSDVAMAKEIGTSSKEFFLIVWAVPRSDLSAPLRFGYAWGNRLPTDTKWLDRYLAEGAKIVRTRDFHWTWSNSKITKGPLYFTIPKDPEHQAELARMITGG
jgi:hypothetical protein